MCHGILPTYVKRNDYVSVLNNILALGIEELVKKVSVSCLKDTGPLRFDDGGVHPQLQCRS